MSKMKKTATAIIIGVSLLGTGAAMAWGGGHHARGGYGGCAYSANLNLTKDQQAQLYNMHQKHLNARWNDADWQQHRKQMQELMQQKNFDENKAKALMNERQKYRTAQHMEFLKDRHAFYQSLTPAQQKIYTDNCMNNAGSRKGAGMGRGW